MNFFQRNKLFVLGWIAFALFAAPAVTFAQTDEIQVYDAEIEDQGKFNIMIHSNFTPSGRTTPAFPGGIVANHSFNGTAEWAYGVADWFEQGLTLEGSDPDGALYWLCRMLAGGCDPLYVARRALRMASEKAAGYEASLNGARAEIFRDQIGMLAQAIAYALDVDDDGVVKEAVQQGGGDDGMP